MSSAQAHFLYWKLQNKRSLILNQIYKYIHTLAHTWSGSGHIRRRMITATFLLLNEYPHYQSTKDKFYDPMISWKFNSKLTIMSILNLLYLCIRCYWNFCNLYGKRIVQRMWHLAPSRDFHPGIFCTCARRRDCRLICRFQMGMLFKNSTKQVNNHSLHCAPKPN